MHKGWLLLLLPCLLLAFLIDLPFGRQDNEDAGAGSEILYDSWSTGLNSTRFNADGSREYSLQAARQVHYIDESTELDAPFVRLYQPTGQHWNIEADSGRIRPEPSGRLESPGPAGNAGLIDLIGNVVLYQSAGTGDDLVLTTTFMTADPDAETLYTDQPVELRSRTIEQTAVGMRANLKENTVTFLAQIRGRYDASQQP